MRITEVTLAATVADHLKGPRSPLPQVAFAGRSNVGKSSLLNRLIGRGMAHVSKAPGKTRTINYYLVNKRVYFVDLPGYGFANRGKVEREGWGESLSRYIAGEANLRLVVGLVDPRVPTSPLDAELAAFVRAAGCALLVVLTKADKLGRGALTEAAARIASDLILDRPPIASSATTGAGKRELLAAIDQIIHDKEE